MWSSGHTASGTFWSGGYLTSRCLAALPAACPPCCFSLFQYQRLNWRQELRKQIVESKRCVQRAFSDQDSVHQQLFYWSVITTRLSPTEASIKSYSPIGLLQLKEFNPLAQTGVLSNKEIAQREAEISPVALESLFYSNPTV